MNIGDVVMLKSGGVHSDAFSPDELVVLPEALATKARAMWTHPVGYISSPNEQPENPIFKVKLPYSDVITNEWLQKQSEYNKIVHEMTPRPDDLPRPICGSWGGVLIHDDPSTMPRPVDTDEPRTCSICKQPIRDGGRCRCVIG